MGMFSRIFALFRGKDAHPELIDAYSRVNQLSSLILKDLLILRKMQRQIVGNKLSKTGTGSGRTGAIGLEKTLFVEEELVKRLKELAAEAEERFLRASESIHHVQPLDPLEKQELMRITSFLEKIQREIPDLNPDLKDLLQNKSDEEVLLAVENALREITNLSKEFNLVEKYERELARKVLEHEISPLLRKMYAQSQVRKYSFKGGERLLYTYPITKKQLRQLEQEAERINACQDPDYEIGWRRWWRSEQREELDPTTPLKEPHINVTIKLFGKGKKEVHLLLAA